MTAAPAAPASPGPDPFGRALAAVAVEAAFVLRAAPRAPGVLKADGSPVTAADLEADRLIREALSRLRPDLAVLSEESDAVPSAEASEHVCVDPLDGTREFLAGSNEFVVNLALVRGGRAELGVVAAPALGLVWLGAGGGAFVARFAEPVQPGLPDAPTVSAVLEWRPLGAEYVAERGDAGLVVAVSRRHGDAATERFVAGLPRATRREAGSALKFCLLAAGEADLYPRFGPTMSWDTAAGQAVLEAAGGVVLDLDGRPLGYGGGRAPNAPFLALGPRALALAPSLLEAARTALRGA